MERVTNLTLVICSECSMAACDREGAVREVAQVYELIKTQQPLLLFHHHHLGQQQEPATKLTQRLLSDALRALNIALSVIKQQQQEITSSSTTASPLPVKAEEPQLSSSNGAATRTWARSSKRRRSSAIEAKNSSWVNVTTVPYEDGYEWRKYGEKRINGTHFTRSYFKCTYKDDKGCSATKYIQQKDDSDPPVFEVTYNNDHTCNCTTATSSQANINIDLPSGGAASNNPPPIGHNVMIKHEATVELPPLQDVSAALPLDDHPLPCQEPFWIGHHYVTAEESDMGQSMEEPPLLGDDFELQDLELLFLYNSFKYY